MLTLYVAVHYGRYCPFIQILCGSIIGEQFSPRPPFGLGCEVKAFLCMRKVEPCPLQTYERLILNHPSIRHCCGFPDPTDFVEELRYILPSLVRLERMRPFSLDYLQRRPLRVYREGSL